MGTLPIDSKAFLLHYRAEICSDRFRRLHWRVSSDDMGAVGQRKIMETHFDTMHEAQTGLPTEKVKEDLRTLARDAEALLKATAGDVSEKAKEARSRLTAALERAKATCAQLEERTLAAAKATDKVIRSHPYESLGVAFGVGLLIGVLVARK